MSETPTPSKGQTKRRGLALPPRGQALARLQDLEQDLEEESERSATPIGQLSDEEIIAEINNAVNTASSNAVSHQGSTARPDKQGRARTTREMTATSRMPVQALAFQEPAPTAIAPVATTAGHQLQARAAREPTTRITVDMPDSMHRKISMLAAETRHSIKDLVLDALATTYFAADQDQA